MTSSALLLFLAPPALGAAAAVDITVTASLDVTDGLARIGYYVPVTLKATNRTKRPVTEIFVATGGPVDVRTSWGLAAGKTDETVVPVFYVGGEVALEVTFFDRAGQVLARVRPEPVEVRVVPDDTALAWLDPGEPEPDDAERDATCAHLQAARLQIVRGGPWAMVLAMRCQLGDAFRFPVPDGPDLLAPLVSLASPIRPVVQPDAYDLLTWGAPAATDPGRAWLWLALFGAVVLVIAAAVPKRRAAWAAVAMGALGLAAAGGIWFAAGGARARLREARFVNWGRRTPRTLPERFVLLQATGGATARFPIPQERIPWPRPLFRSADGMFRPAGVLVIEDDGLSVMLRPGSGEPPARLAPPTAAFDTTRAACLLHTLVEPTSHLRPAYRKPTPEALAEVSEQADVVTALLVEGNRATDADGRSQPIDAWAIEWKTSGDADLAWAGRSLAWWDRHRRAGDGPFLVAWIHDPAPEPPPGIDVYERLPAMVVYGP